MRFDIVDHEHSVIMRSDYVLQPNVTKEMIYRINSSMINTSNFTTNINGCRVEDTNIHCVDLFLLRDAFTHSALKIEPSPICIFIAA